MKKADDEDEGGHQMNDFQNYSQSDCKAEALIRSNESMDMRRDWGRWNFHCHCQICLCSVP